MTTSPAPTPLASFGTTPTPGEPNGSPAVLRFRERVRARIGTAELLAFRVGDERFAFDVRALDEAIDAPVIEPSPFAVPMVAAPAGDPSSLRVPSIDVEVGQGGQGGQEGRAHVAGPVLRGLARVNGRTIPVFDTGRMLGVRSEGACAQVLVMRSGSQRIGLLADTVDDVLTIDLDTIKPPPIDAGDELLLGVTWDGEELTGILDARALIIRCQHRATEGQ